MVIWSAVGTRLNYFIGILVVVLYDGDASNKYFMYDVMIIINEPVDNGVERVSSKLSEEFLFIFFSPRCCRCSLFQCAIHLLIILSLLSGCCARKSLMRNKRALWGAIIVGGLLLSVFRR